MSDSIFNTNGRGTLTGLVDTSYAGELIIPEYVGSERITRIYTDAFKDCVNLTSVIIPDSVISIGEYAFMNCTNLKSIDIPDTLTSLGAYAFYQCKNLVSITIPSGITIIDSNVFRDCASLSSIVIPNNITVIESYAFYDCISLTSIIIPDSVTSIGNYAFRDCTALTSVSIPNSVTDIAIKAFYGSSNLTTVYVQDPNNLTISISSYDWTNTNSSGVTFLQDPRYIDYMIKGASLISLADKIRILSGDEETMTPAVMEDKLDIIIDKMEDALFLNGSTVTANMPSGSWADITCGNGRFVAIRDDAAMAVYSDDGATWTSVTVPQAYHSIAYGAGKFVALGGEFGNVPHIAYSEDAITWTETTVPSDAHGAGDVGFIYGDKFIAVGNSGYGIASDDGVNWATFDFPVQSYDDFFETYEYPWIDIAYGNGKYIAVAEDSNSVGSSDDGLNWSIGGNLVHSYPSTISYGGGKFISIMGTGVSESGASYSEDGIMYTLTDFPYSATINPWSVAYGNGRFVAINNVPSAIYIVYSTDGINWSGYTTTGIELLGAEINDTTVYTNAYSITYDNGKFVVVGKDASLAAISEDGVTWTNTVNNTDIVKNDGTDVTDETIDAVVGDEIDTQTDLIAQIANALEGKTGASGGSSSSSSPMVTSVYGENESNDTFYITVRDSNSELAAFRLSDGQSQTVTFNATPLEELDVTVEKETTNDYAIIKHTYYDNEYTIRMET